MPTRHDDAPEAAIACLPDLEARARAALPPMVFDYIAGGAGDEHTLRWNEQAYQRIRLRPRILVDVSAVDTRLTLLGHSLAAPILVAPTAYHRLLHPDGELATARGSSAAGAPLIISTLGTTAVEEVAAACSPPPWFQLYVQPDRGFTRSLVARAEDAGCRALCLTVDTPVAGPRNREARCGFVLPPDLDLPNLRGLGAGLGGGPGSHRPREGSIYSDVFDASLTWKDIEWVRSIARVPLLLKGVLTAEDAALAVDAGVAGLVVSNHGARNLDTVPATIEALPAVADRVAGRIPILVDGGIRRGTDVLKALALGASAVAIGRPVLHALAAAGEPGVTRAIQILRAELEMAMALTGRPSLAALDRSVLWDHAP